MTILSSIVSLIFRIINLYQMVLIVYALMTWFPNARGTKIWEWVTKLSEPYLEIFDRYIPSIGGVSFNVMIAIFVLELAKKGVILILQLFI